MYYALFFEGEFFIFPQSRASLPFSNLKNICHSVYVVGCVFQDAIRVTAGGCIGALAMIAPDPELHTIITDHLIGKTINVFHCAEGKCEVPLSVGDQNQV